MTKKILFKSFLYVIVLIIALVLVYNFFFSARYKEYIMEGTVHETPIHYVDNNKKLNVMILGGIHGNEVGGIMAADHMVVNEYDWADFIIIPRANIEAVNGNVRAPYYMSDLNRAFPGKGSGSDTERLAYELFGFIEDIKPDLVIDLHEWRRINDEDGSTNSNGIIISSGDMEFYKAMERVYNGHAEANPGNKVMIEFGGISGSLNREVSKVLSIPAVTIESNMNNHIEDRINFQLEIIEAIIKNYRMDD